MVKREVIILYKQTILGFAWAIIRPVFSIIGICIVGGIFALLNTRWMELVQGEIYNPILPNMQSNSYYLQY
jgi:ABC-type polysaccharide/polyol phosphate export permease